MLVISINGYEFDISINSNLSISYPSYRTYFLLDNSVEINSQKNYQLKKLKNFFIMRNEVPEFVYKENY